MRLESVSADSARITTRVPSTAAPARLDAPLVVLRRPLDRVPDPA